MIVNEKSGSLESQILKNVLYFFVPHQGGGSFCLTSTMHVLCVTGLLQVPEDVAAILNLGWISSCEDD